MLYNLMLVLFIMFITMVSIMAITTVVLFIIKRGMPDQPAEHPFGHPGRPANSYSDEWPEHPHIGVRGTLDYMAL